MFSPPEQKLLRWIFSQAVQVQKLIEDQQATLAGALRASDHFVREGDEAWGESCDACAKRHDIEALYGKLCRLNEELD